MTLPRNYDFLGRWFARDMGVTEWCRMQLENFDYVLPDELIAQYPARSRDDSRLMRLDRQSKTISTGAFLEIVDSFVPGDLLILNDTRVRSARLLGKKDSGGQVELLLLRRMPGEPEDWRCLGRSSRPLRPGTLIDFAEGLSAEILPGGVDQERIVRFCRVENFEALIERIGHLPLPPYIRRADQQTDRERYQTVFAQNLGAVAAPTAGLHFTQSLLQQLRLKGVQIETLTLHVGIGTFLPVRVENVHDHRMHSEAYQVPESTATAVNRAKQEGRRVVALGTTAARTLETATDEQGALVPGAGESEIFIFPGYKFKTVNGLVTNFHLPKSTLLMLVSALAGREFILEAYQRAIAERFRFFSYGDCMLIL
nr:tRNA preQ1(34) S-adenosylmethionine ribosyltransferase-isomerase QueA [Geopsychrobacter electrodiphilus]